MRAASLRVAVGARARRPGWLIVGCGDIGLRAAAWLVAQDPRARIVGVVRRPAQRDAVRAVGATPLLADLDAPLSASGALHRRSPWRRLAGVGMRVLHLAPPPADGDDDPRTQRLLAALATTGRPSRLVYVSTTGVYGNRDGAWIDESSPPRPRSARARRRVAAERRLRRAAALHTIRLTILRAPGIYASDRLPLARIAQQRPSIAADEDGWSNHIHADDLARIAITAALRAPNARVFNAVDSRPLRVGDWFDRVADHAGLARPPRLPRDEAAAVLGPLTMSFLDESRRISNARLLRELRIRLHHPTTEGLLDRPFIATE